MEAAEGISTYQIQRYLRSLYLSDSRIPLINPDGIYGEETANAVKIFQQIYALPVTGSVDYLTWEKLREQAKISDQSLNFPEELAIFGIDQLPVKPGSYAGEIYLFQALLTALSLRYANINSVDITGTYDGRTIKAVEELQKLFHLPQTGILDLVLWNKLSDIWK